MYITKYLALIRNERLTYATPWIKLEGIILCEISQSQKDKYYRIPLSKVPRINQLLETQSKKVFTRGWGRGPWELLFKGYRVSISDTEKVLEIVVMVA